MLKNFFSPFLILRRDKLERSSPADIWILSNDLYRDLAYAEAPNTGNQYMVKIGYICLWKTL